MALTPSIWGVFARCYRTVWSWAHIVALTPSLQGAFTFLRRSHPPTAKMLQSGSKILYHHVNYRRDHCHWPHRKRKLRYTPHNPPSRFLCLEHLYLSTWQLHLHQLSLVSSPFMIGGPFITGVCTPSIRCLHNNSLSIFAYIGKSSPVAFIKSTRDFLLYNLHTVSALSFIWEIFFSLHLLSHYNTSLDPSGTFAQSPCALVQFLFSRFLQIPCLCLTAVYPVTTPIQVKIRCQFLSPCCISLPLSGSSSILHSRNHSHRI